VKECIKLFLTLFAWLISHQPTVLFSQNKPATSNQPEPASSILLSEQTSTSHQPPANRTGCLIRLPMSQQFVVPEEHESASSASVPDS
jgi:hypothetical protein